jgi:hypothetical protein
MHFYNFKLKDKKMKELSMPIIHAHCAGIDVGSRFHAVAVDQKKSNIKQFGVLQRIMK